MECRDVAERLPWLLNGSLVTSEKEALLSHLEGCPGCRRELEETRRAAAVFGAHVPSPALADLAWDRSPAGIDVAAARHHLERCPSCSEELSLLRESRSLAAGTERDRSRAPLSAPWYSALAAGLTMALAAGLWWGSARQRPALDAAEAERRQLAGRLAESEAEAERLRERAAELAARLERAEGPQTNLPIVELFARPTRRSAGSSANLVAVPRGAHTVVLVLEATSAPDRAVGVELRGAGGEVLWKAAGLEPGPLGAYTLGLPATGLPDGRCALVLTAPGGAVIETYSLDVRRALE